MLLSRLQALLRIGPSLRTVLSPKQGSSGVRTGRALSALTVHEPSSSGRCLFSSMKFSSLPVFSLLSKGWSSSQFGGLRYSSQSTQTVSPEHQVKIESVNRDDSRRVVSLTWSSGETQDFPFTWLLDNCMCPECYHAESQCRQLPFTELDTTAVPESVQAIGGGETLRVWWNQRHHTDFSSEWLLRVRSESLDDIMYPSPKLWGAEITESLPIFEFSDILSSDEVLYDFLKTFNEVGLLKIIGTPTKPEQIPLIAKRIGPIRVTCFGKVQQVRKGGNRSEGLDVDRQITYTTKELGLHMDNACLVDVACMVFFHCVKSHIGKGGDSVYADGFKAADMLRREDPDAFQTLCTNQLMFRLVGTEPYVGDFDHRCYHTPISLDQFGNLKSVLYSTHSRHCSLLTSVDRVQPMYSALQKFARLLEIPENAYHVKLQAGETMVTNNHRVLHGRTAYPSTSERYLELAFIDWDHVTSRMRVLRKALKGGNP